MAPRGATSFTERRRLSLACTTNCCPLRICRNHKRKRMIAKRTTAMPTMMATLRATDGSWMMGLSRRPIRTGRRDKPIIQLPSVALRVAIMVGIAVVLFAIILFRLWFLQILSGQQFVVQANDNRLRSVKLVAPRGAITDRNGEAIVEHRPGRRLPAHGRARRAARRRDRASSARDPLPAREDPHRGHGPPAPQLAGAD